MKDFHIILAATTSIILFIFGLENFSKEIQKITGDKFRTFLGRATRIPLIGVLIGAVITAFIQSSSATSLIAISLVNAGVLSFKNSLGIIFGSNVGTTVTSQLVALKLTSIAPGFIILGFLLSLIRSRYSVFAKSLFYFGFVFFSLNLISSTLTPLQSDERLIHYLMGDQNIFLGILIGGVVTALVQSSSVTTGIVIIFTQQGLMSLNNAIPILMGANIGTTITALLSIINMDIAAKKTALAHIFFNFGGVILFLPIIYFYRGNLPLLSNDPAVALANFHLLFNVVTTIVFIILINPFAALVDRILGEGKMDFERFNLDFLKNEAEFSEIEKRLEEVLKSSYSFVEENYNLVSLSIETNFKGVYDAVKKRIAYLDFIKSELLNFFSHYISTAKNKEDIDRLMKIMAMYEYIFQIHDSVKDITNIKDSMDQNYIELKSDLLLIVRELSSKTLSFFQHMSETEGSKKEKQALKKVANSFQSDLDSYNKAILKLMSHPERVDAGIILHLITYSQRLKDKLVNYHNLLANNLLKVEEKIHIES